MLSHVFIIYGLFPAAREIRTGGRRDVGARDFFNRAEGAKFSFRSRGRPACLPPIYGLRVCPHSTDHHESNANVARESNANVARESNANVARESNVASRGRHIGLPLLRKLN